MMETYPPASLHVHSMRTASGREVLVARVVAASGRTGYGFSFGLEATEARHMAEWHAGLRSARPACEPAAGHAWEQAWAAQGEIDWTLEPAFAGLFSS